MDPIKRVIIDCDVGTDDYLAILILLDAHKTSRIKIEAIICTAGNTSTENVANNVVRLLENTSQTDIPVYKGASLQLIPPTIPLTLFHGADGLGDLSYWTEPNLALIKPEPGAQAIHDICAKYPNEISLFCVAPLTNLALALRIYNEIPLKDLWVMGGNYTAMGNITACAEFNFYMDPEAVHIVFATVKQPIYLLTWETCSKINLAVEWWLTLAESKASSSKAWYVLHKADTKAYSNYPKFIPCDAFLAAICLDPLGYVVKTSEHHVTIELHGSETRGQLVLDHLKRKPSNVTLLEDVNVELFKQLLVNLL